MSFSLLALGFVSMAFVYRGVFSFIGFSGVQMAGAVFAITTRLVFLDAARFYRRQILVASLGLVFPMLLAGGYYYRLYGLHGLKV